MKNIKLCYYYNYGESTGRLTFEEIREILFDWFEKGFVVRIQVTEDISVLVKPEDEKYFRDNIDKYKDLFDTDKLSEGEETPDGLFIYPEFNITVYQSFC